MSYFQTRLFETLGLHFHVVKKYKSCLSVFVPNTRSYFPICVQSSTFVELVSYNFMIQNWLMFIILLLLWVSFFSSSKLCIFSLIAYCEQSSLLETLYLNNISKCFFQKLISKFSLSHLIILWIAKTANNIILANYYMPTEML